MQRFNRGDSILILPKFAHLYPNPTGTVVAVKPDPLRSILNEYVVEFPDGSKASLFEFQILEDGLNYQNFIATVVYDSQRQPATTQLRGPRSSRQIVLQTPTIDVDIKISLSPSAVMTGQILERGTARFSPRSEVTLMKESVPIAKTTCD